MKTLFDVVNEFKGDLPNTWSDKQDEDNCLVLEAIGFVEGHDCGDLVGGYSGFCEMSYRQVCTVDEFEEFTAAHDRRIDAELTAKENLIYQLETLSSYEPEDLDNPEFDVAYELDSGADTFATVCCIDLAKRTLELIKELSE